MKNFDLKRVLLVAAGLYLTGSALALIAIPVVHKVRIQMAGEVGCVIPNLDGSLKTMYGEDKCFGTPTPPKVNSI